MADSYSDCHAVVFFDSAATAEEGNDKNEDARYDQQVGCGEVLAVAEKWLVVAVVILYGLADGRYYQTRQLKIVLDFRWLFWKFSPT